MRERGPAQHEQAEREDSEPRQKIASFHDFPPVVCLEPANPVYSILREPAPIRRLSQAGLRVLYRFNTRCASAAAPIPAQAARLEKQRAPEALVLPRPRVPRRVIDPPVRSLIGERRLRRFDREIGRVGGVRSVFEARFDQARAGCARRVADQDHERVAVVVEVDASCFRLPGPRADTRTAPSRAIRCGVSGGTARAAARRSRSPVPRRTRAGTRPG